MKKNILLMIALCLSVLLQAKVSKMVDVNAGGLLTALTATEKSTVTDLVVTGTIDARDFKTIRDSIPMLLNLDLKGVTIVQYSGPEGTKDGSNSEVYPANRVPDYAFLNTTNYQQQSFLVSIVLPSSITAIGNSAFYCCRKLTSFTIPASVNYIGQNAFGACSALTSIDIPSSVTTLGFAAFMNCGFTSITIPSSIDTLTRNVFSYCHRLKSVSIPTSVTIIESEAFGECDSLTSVSIPPSVKSIGSYAFCYNKRLDSLSIPSSVTSIGNSAFYNCTNLVSIVASGATPVNLASSTKVFEGVNKTTCKLYVPSGSKALYQAAGQWKDFFNISEIGDFTLSKVKLDFKGNEGSDSIVISSNASWVISSDQPWLVVTPSSGTGSETLIFTATANLVESARIATVTVSAEGVPSKTIIVTQAPKPILEVNNDSVSIASSQVSTVAATIVSNLTWKATSNQSWLTVTPSTGTGNASLTLKASANATIVERTATLTISADGITSKLIQVTQEAGDTTLSVSRSAAVIKAAEGSTASIRITSNTNWTIDCNYSWLTVTPIAGNGTATIVFTAQANLADTVRVANVFVSGIGVVSQSITITQQERSFLQVLSNAVSVDKNEGSTVSVDVLSNISWKAVSDKSWLTISPVNGSLSNTIILSAGVNTEITERSATVTISGTGVESQLIVVTQLAGDSLLLASDTIVHIGKQDASIANVEVTSNLNWEVISSESWLSVNPKSGSGSGTIGFEADANPFVYARSFIVTLSAVNAEKKQITIVQEAGDTVFYVAQTNFTVGVEGGSLEAIGVSSNIPWRAISDQSWLIVTPSSGSGDGTLQFAIQENTSLEERSAKVTVAGGSRNETIIVTQKASKVLLVSATQLSMANVEGSTAEIAVTSNVNWNSTTIADWLSVSPASGSGSGIVVFTATENTSVISRVATIVFSSSDTDSVKITITQAGAEPQLNVSYALLSMDGEEGSFVSIDLISNTSWAITTEQEWLTLESGSGSGNATIRLTGKANTTTVERTAQVIITAPGVEPKVLNVIQVPQAVNGIRILSEKSISLYPNPVANAFQINGLQGRVVVTIFDLQGRIHIKHEVNSCELIPVNMLLNGVYLVNIATNDGLIVKKLIKE